MSRVQFFETVVAPIGPNNVLVPLSGVGAIPYSVDSSGNEGAQAPAYAARTGSTLGVLTTDASGSVSFWLDPGDYNVHISDSALVPRITAYVRGFSATTFSVAQLLAANQPPPIGLISQWAGSNDPVDGDGNTRWFICDGRALDRVAYQTLYNRIGIAYGPGNGSTTFNIPNFLGRMAVGANPTAGTLSARALGASGGLETVALATAELPSHTHAVDPASTGISLELNSTGVGVAGSNTGASIVDSNAVANAAFYAGIISNNNVYSRQLQAAGTSGDWAPVANALGWVESQLGHGHGFTDPGHSHAITDPLHKHTVDDPQHAHTLVSTGGGAAHENMPPFAVVNFIIKVL